MPARIRLSLQLVKLLYRVLLTEVLSSVCTQTSLYQLTSYRHDNHLCLCADKSENSRSFVWLGAFDDLQVLSLATTTLFPRCTVQVGYRFIFLLNEENLQLIDGQIS